MHLPTHSQKRHVCNWPVASVCLCICHQLVTNKWLDNDFLVFCQPLQCVCTVFAMATWLSECVSVTLNVEQNAVDFGSEVVVTSEVLYSCQ